VAVPEGLEFRPGTSDLTAAGEAALAKVGALVDQFPPQRIRIVGHTDSEGLAADNLRLSRLRAESVRSYLVDRYGLDSARIQTDGFGETRPITSNATPEGRRANRRVEIFVRL
jgi:OOP family OmpA-OmpF porin